ncbi:MAG: trehalose-phosphatase [Deltaproteobacteria bacterium]|nr:trehalose-phosphatase [Deltaproteobacteria bacterium]
MNDASPKPPSINAGVPDFWERFDQAPRILLGLDYDGTLAPFRNVRHEAKPLSGISDTLASLTDMPRLRVVIVSGRPLDELATFFPGLPLEMIGAHGWQRRSVSGEIHDFPVDAGHLAGLDASEEAARGAGLGAHLERKTASLALHVRWLSNADAAAALAAARRVWKPTAAEAHLGLREFDGGLELRAPGRHKGVALEELLREMPDGTLPIYVGDDDTDEDAFAAIRERGIGIK